MTCKDCGYEDCKGLCYEPEPSMTQQLQLTEPEPGILQGVPDRDYRNWPAMSFSTLKWGLISMQHLKAAIDGRLGAPNTDALRFGRALHQYLLEPDLFDQNWPISQPCCAMLKSGPHKGKLCQSAGIARREDGGWVCGRHHTDEELHDMLSPSEWAQIKRIGQEMKAHKGMRLLRQHGGCEVSIKWEACGVECKSRLDKLILTPGSETPPPTILDVKKCRNGAGTFEKWPYQIREYAYHMQAAMYQDAVDFHHDVRPRFFHVVVEDTEPHCVGIYEIGENSLEIGRETYRSLLSAYKRCVESDDWPGYTREIKHSGLPQWDIDQWFKARDGR